MATINFLYRSKRKEASLNLRLLFRHNNKDYVIGGKTKVEVKKDYWFEKHNSNSKDIEIQNMQLKLNNDLNSIQNHILESFNKTNPEVINKLWLQTNIDEYYNPPQHLSEFPKELLKYFDVYLDNKRSEIKPSSIKKYTVLKNLLMRYEIDLKKPLLIKNIGLNFKKDFDYSVDEEGNYLNPNTGVAFLCVCDKLLTGFDAPIAQVMYLDKSIREHDLLQAIARVNRTKKDKTHGLLVDYYGVSNNLKEALNIWGAEDEEDIKELLAYFRDINKEIPVLEARYNRMIQLFEDRGIIDFKKFAEQKMTDKEVEFQLAEDCIEMAAAIPLGRFGEPREVAAVAVLLASDEVTFMTGAELNIDGGILAGSSATPSAR